MFDQYEVYQQLKSLLKDESPQKINKTMASLPLLVSVAAHDKKIKKEEFTYLKRYTRHYLDLDKDIARKIAKYFVLAYRDDKSIRLNIDEFKGYVNKFFSIEEKKELVETMFVISRSDLDISHEEKEYIHHFALSIGLEEGEYVEELLKADMILYNKIKDEIKNNPDYQATEAECNDFQVCSSQEFYKNMHKF